MLIINVNYTSKKIFCKLLFSTLTPSLYVEQVPAFSPHCLRHTYTVWSYLAEKQSGNSEPWKNLQVRLGHSSLETTINTYLRVASEFEAQLC